MSGAQGKAAVIAGCVGVLAEINPAAVAKRHEQGWVDEVFTDLPALLDRIRAAKKGARRWPWPTRATWSTCGKPWPTATSPSNWAATRPACTSPTPAATTRRA